MNHVKCATIAFALVLVAGILGGAVVATDDASAEEDSSTAATTYTVTYIVDDTTYIKTSATAEITLSTIADLGVTLQNGYEFTKWNTADDGTGTSYAAGSTYVLTAGADNKLYAQTAATTYTVTFTDADGTVLKSVTGTVKATTALADAAPTVTVPEGKIFAGWTVKGDESGTVVKTADLGTIGTTVLADVTYVAVYTTDYAVTFYDANTETTYVSHISDLVVPDLGDRTGYTFLGWYIGTEQVLTADCTAEDVAALIAEITADTTLTAKWEPVNCTVTFVAGSYSTTMTVLYGACAVEPVLPDGYAKWDFDFSTPITSDITVNAIAAEKTEMGLSNPITMTLVIIIGVLVLAALAAFVYLWKEGKIVIGRASKLSESEEDEKK